MYAFVAGGRDNLDFGSLGNVAEECSDGTGDVSLSLSSEVVIVPKDGVRRDVSVFDGDVVVQQQCTQ